jgi:uncharacterized protein YgiM (DUF1202 family)
MKRRVLILALGCVLLSTGSMAQTTSLQAFPPPFRVPQPADINPNADQTPSQMTVSEPDTAIRSAPGADSQVLGTTGVGTKVMTLDSAGGWTHVISGGADGYISSDSLK